MKTAQSPSFARTISAKIFYLITPPPIYHSRALPPPRSKSPLAKMGGPNLEVAKVRSLPVVPRTY